MRRIFLAITILGFIPLTAGAFSATIDTRLGVPTPPLKIPFDVSAVLGGRCVNHNLKITITASNERATAARFEQVQLYGIDGALLGNNVANKTDALSKTPYNFVFQNFGVPGALLDKVAGVQISFFDAGGSSDTSGKINVSAVLVSDECQSGDSCVIVPDPIVQNKEKPAVTVAEVQRVFIPRNQSGGGGSCSATSSGPSGGGTFANSGSGGTDWTNPSNASADDGQNATSLIDGSGGIYTNSLKATNFGFSVPSGATINGLEAVVHRNAAGSQIYAQDRSVKFVKGGSATGNELAAGNWNQNSDEYKTYGGPTNLVGASWTSSDINSSNFGFMLSVDPVGSWSQWTVYVDYISIKVYYTPATCASIYDSLKNISRSTLNKFFCTILRQKCESL